MLTSPAPRLFQATEPTENHHRAHGRAWRPCAVVPDLLCLDLRATGEIGPWMHARSALTVIQAGAQIRLESRRSVVVDTAAVLLVPPLHVYSVRPAEGTTAPMVTVLFDAPSRDGRLEERRSPAIATRADLVTPLMQLVSDLTRPVRSVERANDIASLLERLMTESITAGPDRSGSIATPLLPLRDYLLAHRSEPVSIGALARIARLTESHCIRAFHQEFGLPPHAYHMRLRLAEASRLLARGQSISTVAYDCGFADQSHLSRKFREVYGVAPGAWASAAVEDSSQPRHASNPYVPGSLMRPERVLRRPRSA